MLRALAAAVLLPVTVAAVGAAAHQAGRRPDIYFATTRQAVVEEMLRLAGVGADDVVMDLGSGDGRIPILAAQMFGARGVGVEIDGALVTRAREIAREAAVEPRVTFLEGDLYQARLTGVTVVTLYLSENINTELEPKLRRDLAPGSRIVSHQFRMGRWPPDRSVRASDGTDLFLWTVR